MLQLRALHRSIFQDPSFEGALAPEALRGEALERHANDTMQSLRKERSRRGAAAGGLTRIGATLDAALRTDAVEHMDEDGYPEKGKLGIALGLHAMNVASASYWRFFKELEPMLRRIHARTGRAPRVLELASGSGGFAFALEKLARRAKLPLEVTASDVVPLYIERGAALAAKTGAKVTFRKIDALDMSGEPEGAYDVVFIAQSVHHFSPGQLARMIRESQRVATTAFVSVDGFRSLGMVAFVAGTAILSLWPAMVHDAVISVRKFYPEGELEAIARMGAPKAKVKIGRIRPLNTVLSVRFDEGS
ncbi:MAG TPA: methyltransferase domain-containing protein [Polyangiaceae bacterium]|jgi:2-polyprenyl-3-methyl-5-hydroxy-6-metoxy-1,4-benzoquinol methylase